MGDTKLFVSVVIFWLVLLSIFAFVGKSLEVSSEYNQGLQNSNIQNKSFSSNLLFIFKIMFWQVPESYGLPTFINILIDMFAIFSIYILVANLNPLSK